MLFVYKMIFYLFVSSLFLYFNFLITWYYICVELLYSYSVKLIERA